MDYPYVNRADRLRQFMAKIPEIGVPRKVTPKTLLSLGFGTAEDEALLDVMTFIGLLKRDGAPSQRWARARDPSTGAKALAKAIQYGYRDLFELQPDAHTKNYHALRTFFEAHSDADPRTVVKMAMTFETICEFADFGDA